MSRRQPGQVAGEARHEGRHQLQAPGEPPNRLRERAHEKLHSQLDGQGRKLLLRLTDLENAIREEASLQSFISGYRLACGIQKELSVRPRYSFDKEEEHARVLNEEERLV